MEADENCLFTASRKAMGSVLTMKELRRRTVRRFLEDLGSASNEVRKMIESAIKHMYSPDLKSGWGIHVVQDPLNAILNFQKRPCLLSWKSR